MVKRGIVIIGGGAAGLAAAIQAKEAGVNDILIIEREDCLGGLLNQCIHSGFGVNTFNEELTGPEYAQRYIDRVEELKIEYKLNTTVIGLENNKIITTVNGEDGIVEIQAKAIILATGRRERPRGTLSINGSKSAGIYTAGTAQKFVNIEGYLPGKEVVILGTDNFALLMARRMILEGANVRAVIEAQSCPRGGEEFVSKCLLDFEIELKLNHTITEVKGKDRVEGVTITKVDGKKSPIKGTEQYIACDTILISVDMFADNDLLRKIDIEISEEKDGPNVNENFQTNIEGIFACGNIIDMHELVDGVTKEGSIAGKNAAQYISLN